ncbi:MAG: hypothetical protein IT379_39410 [Deltaproteobacteria bacterium]|nr:hypothetical protein [Deltaproteobacteria bacterium]
MANRSALARIELRAVGRERVRAVLNGTVSDARGAQSKIRSEQRRTASDTAASAQQQRNVATTAIEAVAKRFVEAERRKQRAIRDTLREAEQSYRAQRRSDQQARREQRRSSGGGGRRGALLGALGGGALALGATAVNRTSGFASAAGIPSRDELVGRSIAFQRGLIRLERQSGRSGLGSTIRNVATDTRTSPTALLGGLEAAQARTPEAVPGLVANGGEGLAAIAAAARAANAEIADVVATWGIARQQLQLRDDQLPEFLGLVSQAAADGAVEFADFANAFGSVVAAFGRESPLRGMEGARQAVGISEVTATGHFGAEETATRVRRLLTELNDVNTQVSAAAAGVRIVREGTGEGPTRGQARQLRGRRALRNARFGGEILPLADIVDQLIANPRASTPAALQRIFKEERARSAVGALLQMERVQPGSVRRLQGSDPEAGQRLIGDINQRLDADPIVGRVDRAIVDAEVNFQRNAQGLFDAMMPAVELKTSIETQFPLLTEALGALTDTLGGAGAGGLLGGALKGGGAGGTGVLGALGAGGAGTAGGAGIASAAGAGALGAAALGGIVGAGFLVAGLGGLYMDRKELGTMDVTTADAYRTEEANRALTRARGSIPSAGGSLEPVRAELPAEQLRAMQQAVREGALQGLSNLVVQMPGEPGSGAGTARVAPAPTAGSGGRRGPRG